MDAPFETFEHDGFTIDLWQDYDAGDPFEQFEQLAEFMWTDREYAHKNVNGRVSLDYDHYIDSDDFTSTAHMRRYLTLMRKYLVAVPFRVYDYGSGGYRVVVCDESDDKSWLTGFLVVSEARRELVGAPLEGLEENAMADFRQWKAWVEGEVVGFTVKAPNGDYVLSVGGFYGETEHVRKEAKDEAEAAAAEYNAARRLPWLPTFGNPIRKAVTT